ncbi:MAG: pilus assembly protein TadG-related protein [Maioricimonas sp. JB049]
MKRYPLPLPVIGDESTGPRNRRGAFIVVAFFCLTACITFVAFSVDVGTISLTKTKMQNAVDAAALAAAMEITHAVENAGPEVGNLVEYSKTQAAQKAVDVAALNGVYVDPNRDVEFGKRSYNESTGQFDVAWNESPSNVVRVIARRDDPDVTQPDGQLQLFFAGVTGDRTARIRAEAVAYVEARDIVTVLDFSGSMTYDSQFRSETVSKLGIPEIETNLQQIYDDLQPVDLGDLVFTPKYLSLDSPPSDNPDDPSATVTFKYDETDITSDQPYTEVVLEFTNGRSQKFTGLNESSGTYSGSGSNNRKDIATVWVKDLVGEEVTVAGESGRGCRPTIEVTFAADTTSVYIESSKDLSNVVLEFEDGTQYKFDNLNQGKTGTFQGLGDNAGKTIETVWVKSGCNHSGDGPGYGERFDTPDSAATLIAYRFDDTNENVEAVFGLDNVSYPYPSGSWNHYIDYVRSDSDIRRGGYREMYGGMTFVHYLLDKKRRHYQTPDLYKTRHYPFHAIKEGHTLFASFLKDLGFGDTLGLVSYDTYHRLEMVLNDAGMPFVDISAEPLTSDYDSVATIMRHKQAAHYYDTTNIGGGISRAIASIQSYGRPGARPTILLMTDGNANVTESYTVPPDWDWDALFDYDGDGAADYELSGGESNYEAKMFALVKAREAVSNDMTIHTLSVGAGADRDLMRAIAHMANGHWIDVPGGSTIAEMETEVLEAFNRIAAFVPPAKLLSGH